VAIAVAVIPVAIAVPTMVVLAAAVFAVPVASVKAFPVMTRSYPARAFVGRTSPISVVPPITTPNGIPITVDPNIARAG